MFSASYLFKILTFSMELIPRKVLISERSAFASAVSAGEREFSALAVCGGRNGEIKGAFFPCGVCRQVIREFCADDFPIYVLCEEGRIVETTLSALLPNSFGKEAMYWYLNTNCNII